MGETVQGAGVVQKFRAAALAVCAVAVPSLAQAQQQCQGSEMRRPAADIAELEQRLKFIETTLRDQNLRATWWNWGFRGGAAAAVGAQAAVALTTKETGEEGASNARAVYLFNSARGTLTFGLSFILGLNVVLPDGPMEDVALCQRLLRAERALRITAEPALSFGLNHAEFGAPHATLRLRF